MSVCPADGKQAQENITIWIAKKAGSFLSPPPAQTCQLALKSAGWHTGLVGMGLGGAATVSIKGPQSFHGRTGEWQSQDAELPGSLSLFLLKKNFF